MTRKNTLVNLLIAIVFLSIVILYSYGSVYGKNIKIKDYSNEKMISFTINGENATDSFPKKESGYIADEVTCKNGVTASWDNEKWGIVNIESNGNKKINCNVNFTNSLTVSFDANGGNVDLESKSVQTNSTYGTLPIPTKEGYVFKGWNGKNLFDLNMVKDNTKLVNNVEIEDDQYFVSDFISVENDKDYVISGISESIEVYSYDSNMQLIDSTVQNLNASFRLSNNTSYIKLNGLLSDKNNIQLEINTESTSYESYFVNNSTIVSQNRNHTLKAIWGLN